MKLYCLSSHPNKSCNILTFKEITIMLDCGLDMVSALTFLPLPLVYSSRLFNLPSWTPRNTSDPQIERELRDCNGRVFVDSCPEFCPPEAGIVDFSQVDLILISNYHCMMALPYITEGTGFSGLIYATEPTIHIARQFMEEIVTYIERTPKIRSASRWKQPNILSNLPPPLCDALKPRSWKQIYSMKEVNSCLSKVNVIGFGESLNVFGAFNIQCISSGYSLGSCNWIIETDHEKISYISASSTLTNHPKPMELTSLRNSSILIVSSLTQTPLANPDTMLGEICVTVANVLRNGGNVLIPSYPSGITFDLFECLSNHLESTGNISAPMFFLSSVADNSLAYSNIIAEWLSQGKQCKVYTPEELFPHAQLIKGGRLKVFSSLKDETFSQEFRTPCIVFAGHPSLRFGDAVHFMELWCTSANNCIIFTEPDFPHVEALAPYQPVAMKVLYCPIDTSLSFTQINKVIRDIKPCHLLLPEQYTVPSPMYRHRTDLTVEADCNIIPFKRGDIVRIPVKRTMEKVILRSEVTQNINLTDLKDYSVATITGVVDVQNNKYELKLYKPDGSLPFTKKAICEPSFPEAHGCGSLDVSTLVQKLNKEGFTDVKVDQTSSGCIVDLQGVDTLIQIDDHSTHIISDCDSESDLRTKLYNIVADCVIKC